MNIQMSENVNFCVNFFHVIHNQQKFDKVSNTKFA